MTTHTTTTPAPDAAMTLAAAIARVAERKDLTRAEIAGVFGRIMAGEATPAQIGGLLLGLRVKGETADELAGAAAAMRAAAAPFSAPDPARTVDTCGTGGDGSGSVNVSTMAAVVVAACGTPVAKHGNRALSSRSGSADVLEALGVAIDVPREVAERCLAQVNIAFLFAPSYHAATRHAAGPRRELGTRTMFNLLGPMTNPAGAQRQLVGVFDGAWCEPVARALGALGSRRAFVVHGAGGIDELAVRGPTRLADWDAGRGDVVMREVTPRDFGLYETDPAGLLGGDAAYNAAVAHQVLGGGDAGREAAVAPVRVAVVMAASAALVAADAAGDFRDGAERASEALDTGAAARTLAAWAAFTQGAAAAAVSSSSSGGSGSSSGGSGSSSGSGVRGGSDGGGAPA